MKSGTEFEFWGLSKYQVGTGLIGIDSSRWRLLATSQSIFVCIEWWGYEVFQLLFLMLKFSIIIRTLFKFTLVFFIYFKVVC